MHRQTPNFSPLNYLIERFMDIKYTTLVLQETRIFFFFLQIFMLDKNFTSK